jgi:hypothetical protein
VWDGTEWIREVNGFHDQVFAFPFRILEQLVQQYPMIAAFVRLLDQTLLSVNINFVMQVHLLEDSCHQT